MLYNSFELNVATIVVGPGRTGVTSNSNSTFSLALMFRYFCLELKIRSPGASTVKLQLVRSRSNGLANRI